MSKRVIRRKALQLGVTAAALPLAPIRTAGKRKLALWDQSLPKATPRAIPSATTLPQITVR